MPVLLKVEPKRWETREQLVMGNESASFAKGRTKAMGYERATSDGNREGELIKFEWWKCKVCECQAK